MVNNGIQRLSPELKRNMRFSLSFCLKPQALLMWFIKQLSQSRPLRQMRSIACEEEIPVEADTATGFTTGSQLQVPSHRLAPC